MHINQHTIQEMKSLAEKQGGKCLSERYINTYTKLEWQCKKRHIWETIPKNILKGHWCPTCAATDRGIAVRKYTIDDMKKLASEHGGKCLSDQYTNPHTKLRWQCSKGHVWESEPNGIRAGHWCGKCSEKEKHTLLDAQKLAESRGGKCLSKKYISSRAELMIWKCKEGHVWKASYDNVNRGTWCRICAKGINERICRLFFEKLFGKKFPSLFPKWLVNSNGYKMELDGYCEDLKIAFEYQGQQHYKDTPYFNSGSGFAKRKKYDIEKKKLCKKHGVVLFEIPYSITVDLLPNYVEKLFKEKNLKLPNNINNIILDHINFYDEKENRTKELQDIAKLRDGRLISKKYIGGNVKLKWQCNAGHIWEATPINVKRGTWCRICGHKITGLKKRLKIEEFQKIATQMGGVCFSKIYVNNRSILKFRCKFGHIWESSVRTIKKEKRWCPICFPRKKIPYKYSIEDMDKIAIERGGKCLSKVYLNPWSKLKWQCAKKHKWETAPQGIIYGNTWCPICGRKKIWEKRRLKLNSKV